MNLRWTDPRHKLMPGPHPDRQVTRLDIATAGGPVPAVHIVPRGGARAVVCYVHGSGSSKYAYTWGITDALLGRGLAVLLFDLDGHGESTQVQEFPGTLRSVGGVLLWLRAHYRRVGAIGTSLGGCIAARAAADGAPLDALVILEAPLLLRLARQHVWLEALRLLSPAVLRLLRDGSPYHLVRTWSETPPIRARIGTQQLIERLDLFASLRRIAQNEPRLPLLLVYGGRDAIVPREQAAQVRQAMPAWAEFHLLHGASHLSLLVDARMHRLVSAWLAARLSERPAEEQQRMV